MSIVGVLRLCVLLYVVLILADLVRSRRYRRFLLELLLLAALVIVNVLITNESTGYLTFGAGTSPVLVILVMWGAILLGTAVCLLSASEVLVAGLCQAPLHLTDLAASPHRLTPGNEGITANASGFFRVACLSERILLAGRVGTYAAEVLIASLRAIPACQ